MFEVLLKISLILTGFCWFCFAAADNEVLVKTKYGTVKGYKSVNYTIFLGVPYARPPVGDLRFSKPVAPETWSGVYNGSRGASCAVPSGRSYTGSEDCLYLTIFSPSAATNKTKAVMIWLDGDFQTGIQSLSDGPGLTRAEDVVFVRVSYRMNIFGFLSTGDNTLPGNLGLWDQRQAIIWVKENIADFGGDPTRITLFGNSAGVTYQMLTPHNDVSLFQRAISHSSSAFSLTHLHQDPVLTVLAISNQLDCQIEKSLVTCLKGKSVMEMMNAASSLHHSDYYQLYSYELPPAFFPVADGDFLPHNLKDILANYTTSNNITNVREKVGNFADFDLMGGWNDQDGLDHMINMVRARIDKRRAPHEALLLALRKFPFYNYGDSNHTEAVTADLYANYYMNKPDTLTRENWTAILDYLRYSGYDRDDIRSIDTYMEIAGDVAVKLPTLTHLQLHADLSNRSTYNYEFTVKGKKNHRFNKYRNSWLTGAGYGDEIEYIYGKPLLINSPYTEEEKQLSLRMMRCWANFVRTGDPGEEFELFNRHSNQTYTVLKLGEWERRTLPLSNVQRLWSAFNDAVISNPPPMEPSCKLTNKVNASDSEYLSGVALTPKEVNILLTGLVVGVVLLGSTTIILLAILVVKCRSS